MLCQIPDITKGVISLFVSGRISTQDYIHCLLPLMSQARKERGRVCLYIEADVLLEGWEDLSVSGGTLQPLPELDALVFVGGPDWVGNAVHLLGPFLRGDIAWFPLEQKQAARDWISHRSDCC
ncbi:MAG: STAS/SEC14 domain-containing protein [Shewanella sp.]|nr:STAS/SEC14 domain-containing protein [Shewanella sp.]MCF1430741.1 STAS/SEC14 domain-containing protein [Shewanella sp.]MCF1438762.1 STAS/SEC14 domain-containing protein [Shewanella sp.]MCF1459692.1 STAS/SEC14 domain-containing protein [Shewanella sp.]